MGSGGVPNLIFEERLIGEFSELRLQFRSILKVAWQIWQILQISVVICRILQIPPGSANCKPKFLSIGDAKACSQKILQSSGGAMRVFWGEEGGEGRGVRGENVFFGPKFFIEFFGEL